MLDSDTKRRIDTARDILVGKVPDPKSQVEQITIALIYKFMDDMDAEAEELGGKRKFFSGEYARYGWAKLMRSGLGGHETLNLYAEAIAKMPENPGIPPLFRDIFKNAFLPYRDPETLRAFLKIIDEFEYDHSERLGDAFEYLLSVLGSQGDAGQFRTPRHIIDFIVEVVDPKKDETVLDPACGTAGFLISAWKHILRTNSSPEAIEEKPDEEAGKEKLDSSRIPPARGDLLTPDERARLTGNIKGYDISPDMVRLSLVNLYLHGFADPHIAEYDTLTSEERWNEHADVILANPPFMSPKGGIRPHNRFSVQSKRSEVLFVDYIAEHLTPNGRAGIIVPEGIIFQSQNAYKQLRQMLVDDYLVAVVSLPAGVFQPYSGVKTSILILDKALARQADTIAFFKIEHDGFALGAQRRPIDKNDLPQARAEIAEYLRRLRARESVEEFQPALGLVVAKEKIAANRDYNLSGERYRGAEAAPSSFPSVRLDEVCDVNPEQADPAERYSGYFNYIDISCVDNGTGKFLGANKTDVAEAPSRARRVVRARDVLLSTVRPNLKAFALLSDPPDRSIASTGFALLRARQDRLLPEFLIQMLRHESAANQMIGMMEKGSYPSINQADVNSIQIPLPPLEVQKKIVAEIWGYQKVIDGARAVLENYRAHIPVHPDWPMVELREVCEMGGQITTEIDGSLPSFGADSIECDTGKLLKTKSAAAQGVRGPVYEFQSERLLYSKIRPYLNKLTVVNLHGYCSSDMYPLARRPGKVEMRYLATYMLSDSFNESIRGYYERASIPKINQSQLFRTTIPLPPLETQRAIVAEIEAEQTLVQANRDLITRMEKKVQATLSRVCGETPEGEQE